MPSKRTAKCTAKRWAHHTKARKSLPDHVKKAVLQGGNVPGLTSLSSYLNRPVPRQQQATQEKTPLQKQPVQQASAVPLAGQVAGGVALSNGQPGAAALANPLGNGPRKPLQKIAGIELLDAICCDRASVLEEITDLGLATISSRIVRLVNQAIIPQTKAQAKDRSDYCGLLSNEALEKASIGVAIPIAKKKAQAIDGRGDKVGSVAVGATHSVADLMTKIWDGGFETEPARITRKMAADQDPTPRVSLQSFMPVSPKRRLTDDEQRQVQRGRSRWFPEIFQGYGTPLPNMLASPGRQALLAGLGGAVGGGLLGANIGAKITTPRDAPLSMGSTPTLIGSAAVALGLGGIAALITKVTVTAPRLNRQAFLEDGVVIAGSYVAERGPTRNDEPSLDTV